MAGISRLSHLFKIAAVSLLLMCSRRMTTVMKTIEEGRRRTDEITASGQATLLLQEGHAYVEAISNAENTNKELPLAIAPTATSTVTPQRKRKRQPRNKRHPNKIPPINLKVPLPIFIPSLPKSGTTSIHKYFTCGNQNSAHHVYRIDGKVRNKIGKCWQRNIQQRRPPLEGCGNHDIWSDTGFVSLNYRKGETKSKTARNIPCYYPLIEALDQIYDHYPNSTFLFVTRNETNWLNSIQTYHEGFIMDVWKGCKIDGFPGLDATLEGFQSFYRWHKQLIQNFARDHPSITYIEVPLEADDTAQVLADTTGVPKTCWGHHNQQQQTGSTLK